MMRKYQVRFGGGRTEKVHAGGGYHRRRQWNLDGRLPYLIWGFQHVAGFKRRHVGASIQDAWTRSLASVREALDADPAHDRAMILRATTREIAPTRDGVLEAVVQRLDVPQKQAAEAYTVAEAHETNPRSVWGYVQGLT